MFDGSGISAAINGIIVICFISIPLGIWKLIEIIIWLFK